jgi:hypothetical protein
MDSYVIDEERISLKEKKYLVLLLLLLPFVCLLANIGLARYLTLLFPVMSFSLGVILLQFSSKLYILFSIILHFFGSEVQRYIDFKSNTFNAGYLTFSADLVTALSCLTFFKCIFKDRGNVKLFFPYLISIAACIYTLLISLINNPPQDFLLVSLFPGLINPIFFGFYLVYNWRDYRIHVRILEATFIWGGLALSIYGLYQFFVAPEWDTFWLNNTEKWSYGLPEPFSIRIWSGTHNYHVYATTMIIGIMFLLLRSNRFFSSIHCWILFVLTLLLTQARASWLTGLSTLLFYVLKLKFKDKIILITVVGFLLILFSFIVQFDPFSAIISDRLSSFFNLEEETSFNARVDGYEKLIVFALLQPIGQGIGAPIDTGDTGYYIGDGSVIPFLIWFGWIGITLYLLGVFSILLKLISVDSSYDKNVLLFQSISIGIFTAIPLNNILMGTLGLYFWSFTSIGLSAKWFHSSNLFKELN